MRWTLRSLMILVAVAGLGLPYGLTFTDVKKAEARRIDFRFRIIDEMRLVRAMQNTSDYFRYQARTVSKGRPGEGIDFEKWYAKEVNLAQKREDHHRDLVARYSFASEHPMLPVLPDWWGCPF